MKKMWSVVSLINKIGVEFSTFSTFSTGLFNFSENFSTVLEILLKNMKTAGS